MSATRNEFLRAQWDDNAESYYAHVQRFRLHDRTAAFLAAVLESQPKRILDFGCGPGNSTRVLRRLLPDCHIVGVDWSPAMIAIAERVTDPADEINYYCGEIDSLPAEPHTYDAVICCNSFFTVDDKATVLDCFNQLVKADGQIVFSMPDAVFRTRLDTLWPLCTGSTSDDDLMRVLLVRLRRLGHPALSASRELATEADLVRLFGDHGFRIKCAGVLRVLRTPEERLAFLRFAAASGEMFSTVPRDVLACVLNETPPPQHVRPQERNMYALVGKRAQS